MAVTPNSIITPQNPYCKFADLTAATGLTSRAPITGTTGTVELATTSAAGMQVASIQVKAASSAQSATVAQIVYIWEFDGTTSWLVDEIVVSAQTPSTTAVSFQVKNYYSGWTIPATHSLRASTSVTTLANTTALIVQVLGGTL